MERNTEHNFVENEDNIRNTDHNIKNDEHNTIAYDNNLNPHSPTNIIVKKKISQHIDKIEKKFQDENINKDNNNNQNNNRDNIVNKKDKDEELYRLMKLQNQVTSIESERLEINKVNVEPIHSYTYNNKLNINTNNNSANTLNKGQISNSQEINNTNYISVNVNLDLNEEASNQKRYVIDQNIKGLELKESPKKLQKKDKDQESNSKDKSPSKPNKIRIEDMN